ncbi:hypothetical protein [Eubacterium pyruvativorans]|uniref:hypothetical protein n=1 Tax=Eubacterium pyruvativorans TaxID=155865 RepID=UPI0015A534B4|nr:hypothetical protein [Eubacterium pyruvativorans]
MRLKKAQKNPLAIEISGIRCNAQSVSTESEIRETVAADLPQCFRRFRLKPLG